MRSAAQSQGAHLVVGIVQVLRTNPFATEPAMTNMNTFSPHAICHSALGSRQVPSVFEQLCAPVENDLSSMQASCMRDDVFEIR